MSSNPIIEKLVWHVKFRIEEPLCVSGGTDVATDMDVIKDFDGNPFVPGSSVAGAFKHYLDECGEDTSLLGGGTGEAFFFHGVHPVIPVVPGCVPRMICGPIPGPGETLKIGEINQWIPPESKSCW